MPSRMRRSRTVSCTVSSTVMPDSLLSAAFVQSVNGLTRYHTRSPNTHLPMWSGTSPLPIGPTMSRFSILVACPIIQTTVFDAGVELKFILQGPYHATALGQSISPVITRRRGFQGGYSSCPSSTSYCGGDLHLSWFSIAAHHHLCRSQHVHPLCQLFTCMRVRSSLSLTGKCKDPFCLSILHDQHPCNISAEMPNDKCTEVDINHRALDADVDVQGPCQPHSGCNNP